MQVFQLHPRLSLRGGHPWGPCFLLPLCLFFRKPVNEPAQLTPRVPSLAGGPTSSPLALLVCLPFPFLPPSFPPEGRGRSQGAHSSPSDQGPCSTWDAGGQRLCPDC